MDTDPLDILNCRTDRQTDALLTALDREAKAANIQSESGLLDLYRQFGVRNCRSLFDGCNFDACYQTFRDGIIFVVFRLVPQLIIYGKVAC